MHVTLVPFIKAAGEVKTKPTQHSVKELREIGIQADILLCRSEVPLGLRGAREDRALLQRADRGGDRGHRRRSPSTRCRSCSTTAASTTSSCEQLGLPDKGVMPPDLSAWERVRGARHATRGTSARSPSSASTRTCATPTRASPRRSSTRASPTTRACTCAGSRAATSRRPARWRCSATWTASWCRAASASAASRARSPRSATRARRSVPFFGICLGMQVATIEFARNVVGWADANSSEFDPQSEHQVIDLLADQANVTDKGGTMRLGAYRCALREGSLAARAYGKPEIEERHRHRYELNNKYAQQLTSRGLVLSRQVRGPRAGRDRRAAGPPVVPGGAVPSRAEVAPAGSAPAVPRLRARRAGAPPGAAGRRRVRRQRGARDGESAEA